MDNINDKQLKPVLKNQSDLTIEICIRKCHNETNGTQSEMTFAALAVSEYEHFPVLVFI